MLRNKILFAGVFMLLTSFSLSAQKKFRPSLNLSGADQETWNFGVLFGINQFDETQDFPEGLNIRFSGEKYISNGLDLRIEPGFIFQKELKDKDSPSFSEVQLPFLVKYSATRVSNINPFIIAGYHPAYRLYDPQSAKKNSIANYIESGMGFDLYLRKSKASFHLRIIKNISRLDNNLSETSGIFLGVSVETRDGWKLYRQ